ncbi:MAG: tetratricopeptide repeat protein [Cytophagales bacterium]|nr:tetratricopeptide repeat protein [Cytophagales bacterium]
MPRIVKLILFIIFFACQYWPSHGQSLDSLKTLLTQSSGTARIELLHTLSRNLRWSQPDESLKYATEALKLAELQQNTPLQATSYRLIGGAHYYLGNYESSLLYSERSLNIAESIGDTSLMITNLNSLGIDNYDLGNYEASMQYFLEAVDLMNANGGKLRRAIVLNNIGLLFEQVGDAEQARSFSLMGLGVAKENNNTNVQVYSYNGIGISYMMEDNYTLALQYLDSAQKIAKQVNNRIWGSVAHNYSGEIYRLLKRYDSAEYHFGTALRLSESVGDQKRIADVYTNQARLCLVLGNLEKCLFYLDKSQELAATYNWRKLYLDNLKLYADVYSTFHMHHKAIESQAAYVEYRDSIYNDIMNRNLELIPLKLSEQKDRIRLSQQQAALDAQRVANLVYLAIIVIAIPIAILLFYLLRKNKKQNKVLEAKNEEIRQTQDLLVKSEKMASLGVLAAGIGHEINNPLNYIENGVLNISNILKEDFPDKHSPTLDKFIDIVNEGVNRASTIVNSLANFSRSGQENNEFCDLEAIAENCLVILSSKTKGIQFNKVYSNEKLLVKGNESKLHQVCMNLLANAIHAVSKQPNPTIAIRTEKVGDELVLTIKDNGYGIDEENLSKISDPFFTTKSPGEGTGLGLFIAHSFIDEHNGRLEVKSIIGNGATFLLHLPFNRP